MEMRIKNCVNTFRPTRKHVYYYAYMHKGSAPSGDHNEAIKYDDNGDLVVNIAFEDEDDALGFEDDVVRNGDEESVVVTYQPCTIPTHAVRINRNLYDATRTDSPSGTISTVLGDTVKSSSDEALYQSLEQLDIREEMRMDCSHLVDKAKCAEVGICSPTNKSNILVVCPNFHRMLDGTTGEGGSNPSVYVEGLKVDRSDCFKDTSGKYRYRVNVQIVFPNQDDYAKSKLDFDDSTEQKGLGVFHSHVFVRDPEIFMDASEWKAKKVRELWLE